MYPFVEINSFFGEIEIFENSKVRNHICIAKKNTLLYTIPKIDLLNIFKKKEYNDRMLKFIKTRKKQFMSFEKKCRKHLRKK